MSGADDVGPEGALLATLEFENSGAETVMIIRELMIRMKMMTMVTMVLMNTLITFMTRRTT